MAESSIGLGYVKLARYRKVTRLHLSTVIPYQQPFSHCALHRAFNSQELCHEYVLAI